MIGPDLKNGFLETLSALTDVNLDYETAVKIFQRRMRDKISTYVAVDEKGQVLATATLIFEHKFIHSGGIVGHIEDVAVRQNLQGQGYGRQLVKNLIEEAERMGCYKVILDCKPEIMPYYEKEGFQESQRNMRINLPRCADGVGQGVVGREGARGIVVEMADKEEAFERR